MWHLWARGKDVCTGFGGGNLVVGNPFQILGVDANTFLVD